MILSNKHPLLHATSIDTYSCWRASSSDSCKDGLKYISLTKDEDYGN